MKKYMNMANFRYFCNLQEKKEYGKEKKYNQK
jgi:hypothetical protein